MARIIIALLALLPLSFTAMHAQQQGRADSTYRSDREPEISITATVTARELTFEAVGDGEVRLSGSVLHDTLHHVERVNLPKPVAAGITYRNIGVKLAIAITLADADQIVSAALGIIPDGKSVEENKEE